MSQVRRRLRALFATSAVLASLMVVPQVANATSVYDDAVHLTDVVVVAASSTSTPIDVSYNWDAYIASAAGSCTTGIKASLLNALDHGSVAVNQQLNNSSSTDYRRVQVSWSESTTVPAMVWSGSGSSASVAYPSIYPGPPVMGGAILFMNATGNVQVFCDVGSFAEPWSNAVGTALGFFATNPPNYSVGYEGEIIPSAPPSAKNVAAGDSFSSAEGNPSFEAGTDQGGVNECHRSPKAYPRLLQVNSNFKSMNFVACAGATTDTILYGSSGIGSWGEGPQINAISSATEHVTITMGGNNIKFSAFARACVLSSCDVNSDEYHDSWDIMTNPANSNYLPPKLGDVFDAIRQKLTNSNVNAKVYVIGYPKVITYDSWSNRIPYSCSYWSEQSVLAAESVVERLDEVIKTAVDDLNDPRFNFVDPLDSSSPFIGHELCRSDNYFNGVNVSLPDAYIFHPNALGHQAYKQLVIGAIG